ncbi:MAG TPA: succinate dehydrogenase/fumarate reductase iron-sulfur subunit [Caldithrix abyssi]|uniref:Succinate dehydrogenase/fumarate reductase iron-sulfur subunit n=1 Tax=Caldithrix abyssi TaxID=187145 RepID=A0A7V5H4E3_CALAY|nr:succinate dehydrogenase/fumarate reductase iron-sulfur subunit [Caldithrix abyssi]
MEKKFLTIHLKVWRQKDANSRGEFKNYLVKDVNPDMSFLEMLDVLNEDLIKKDEEPIEFDNDCREGICGMCGAVINGTAHGPESGMTTCDIRMRMFKDGDTIVVEPFRARAFPPIKDLVVDRSALDRIMSKGGYTSVRTGGVPEALTIPVPKEKADEAMDMAACIGCGACVAACPNASAALFVAAKVSQLALLPQGRPEAARRVERMVAQMDEEGFGACSNHGECEAVCPKEISITAIARMRREYWKSMFK